MSQTTDPVEILRAVLRDHDVSQAEFADEAGVAHATINRWLNRRTELTPRKLADALVAVGIPPQEYGLRVSGLPKRANAPGGEGAVDLRTVLAQIAALEERNQRRHEEVLTALREVRKAVRAR